VASCACHQHFGAEKDRQLAGYGSIRRQLSGCHTTVGFCICANCLVEYVSQAECKRPFAVNVPLLQDWIVSAPADFVSVITTADAPVQAFAEVLANNESWSAPMDDTYELLGVDPASITSLEQYLKVSSLAVG
jgi:hypothetical protein